MRIVFTLMASLAVSTAQADTFTADVPHMIERAKASGIVHEYTGDFEHFVGGGAAGFDCNGDRMPDLAIAGGTSEAALFVNRSITGGALNFEKIPLTDKPLKRVTGIYPVNLDNDEFMDLAVLRVGRNYLLKGGKNCTFTHANDAFDFDGGKGWTTGFSAIWEGTHPTIAFGNYIDRKAPGTPFGTCEDNVLVRPDNDGRYASQTPLSPGFCSLSIQFTDWNNEGRHDLRISNDRQYHRGGFEQLWAMEEVPREYDAKDGWRKLVIWGMGIAQADLDADGRPEFALSSMGDTMLQALDKDTEDEPVYEDIAFDKGATAHRPYVGENIKPSTGWHTQFADFNNDALSDLFIAKGNVEQMPDFAAYDPDNMLMGTHAGKFVEQGDKAGIALETKGRGAVAMDFNADGMVDLAVVNRGSPVTLFQNHGRKTKEEAPQRVRPMGNFIAIELDQGKVNKQAVGAMVSVKTGNHVQNQWVSIGGGHASGQIGFTHFGLGVAERASIRVRWPDGGWSQPYRAFANSFVVLKRDAQDPVYWIPPR